MEIMFEHLKRKFDKGHHIQDYLNIKDPIDQQILNLLDANEISIDVIDLDDPPSEKKKPNKSE